MRTFYIILLCILPLVGFSQTVGNLTTYNKENGPSLRTVSCITRDKDSFIEGSVDFIFGGSPAFFDNCQLESTRGGYITAVSTPEDQSYGYVFHRCILTARAEIASSSVYLSRPWRPNAKVIFIECAMDKHIQQPGWHNWGNPDNEKTAFYTEYKSIGAGASIDTRVSWSRQLTDEQAANFSYHKVIGDKHPDFIADDINLVIADN